MIYEVRLVKSALKDLRRVPDHIKTKFGEWVASVEINGLEATRRLPGWHDEPLKGSELCSYRAIYVERKTIEVLVLEVNKHDY